MSCLLGKHELTLCRQVKHGAQNALSVLHLGPLRASGLVSISAVHVRHATHKATTQRDVRAASLRCTGRRRASAGKAAR